MTEFSNLSNFFAVFVALNLAYSGLKQFRINFNEHILKLGDVLVDLKDSLASLKESNPRTSSNEAKRIFLWVESKHDTILSSRVLNTDFEHTYKDIFLLSGFFCIVMILLLGLPISVSDDLKLSILTYSFLIIFLKLYIFTTGFTTAKGQSIFKKITTIKVIKYMVFIYIIALFIAFSNEMEIFSMPIFSLNVCISLSVLIAILPFTLFLIKAYLYREKNKLALSEFEEYASFYREIFLSEEIRESFEENIIK